MVALKVNNKNQKLRKIYTYPDDNKIIGGYFDKYRIYKELAVTKVNKTLCLLIGLLIIVTLISYYFVTSSEIELNTLRKEIISVSEENIELQNKLDYLSSFYNVDKTIKNKNLLNTAKQVIEVEYPSNAKTSKNDTDIIKTQDSQILELSQSHLQNKIAKKNKLKWSIGY